MDYRSMDTAALEGMLLNRIQELEQQKLVDHHFRQCHSLKEDNGVSFFLDLIIIFLHDAEAAVNEMANILYKEVVDFNNLYSYYIKLKGSSACFGACRIRAACSNLGAAIDKGSKQEFLRPEMIMNLTLKAFGSYTVSHHGSSSHDFKSHRSLEVLGLINEEHKNLQHQLNNIIEIEQELVSRATG